jgi:glycosyltransferase involved in cell wall biosynthesis
MSSYRQVRVLYSFPHRLGAGRICHTAWHQVAGLAAAGAQVTVHAASVQQALPHNVDVRPTLSRGRLRIPFRVVGKLRALAIHDYLVARRLEREAGEIDIVHTWPMAARETLRTAARLGIPTVLERPNAHTRFYYELVRRECEHLSVTLPRAHEHAFNAAVVSKEEEEYALSYRLLCPSEFVVNTFLQQGFPPEKLARHGYGYDENLYYPADSLRPQHSGLTMIFVGVCVPAKGLHYALEAWLRSVAHRDGTFLIAGRFLPAYADRLSSFLSHSSVKVLGHRDDVPVLMRSSDVLVLPSIGEGFGLVIADAMGSGTVPLVSDACTDICKHMKNALVHRVGDVEALTRHINMMHENLATRQTLRAGCLQTAPTLTWAAAGKRLLDTYRDVIAAGQAQSAPNPDPITRTASVRGR